MGTATATNGIIKKTFSECGGTPESENYAGSEVLLRLGGEWYRADWKEWRRNQGRDMVTEAEECIGMDIISLYIRIW